MNSINNLLSEYKKEIDNLITKEQNAQDEITTLEQELKTKNYQINNYKIKHEEIIHENDEYQKNIYEMENFNKKLLNKIEELQNNVIKYKTDFLKNQELLNDIEIMKKKHLKEINEYKEIIKRKEVEFKEINKDYINSKKCLEKILELQNEIIELKKENNQLILKIHNYEKIILNDQNNISLSHKEANNRIKSAYQAMIEENEQLKDNILKLRKYH